MKKVLILILFFLLASFAFAKPGSSAVVGLGDSYPLNGKNVAEYMLLFASLNVAYDHTFDGGSAAFNPGLGFHLRQNPITLLGNSFFGSVGVKVLNLIDLGVLGLRPYVASDLVFYLSDPTSSAYYRGFYYFDFSAGISISLAFVDIDVAFVTPYDPRLIANNFGSALRFSLGYRTFAPEDAPK